MVRPVLVWATVAVLLCCVAVESGRVRRESDDNKKGENNFAKCLEDSTNAQEALDCLSELLGLPINQNCLSGVLRGGISEEGSGIPGPMDDPVPFPIQPGTGGKIAKKVDDIATKVIAKLGR